MNQKIYLHLDFADMHSSMAAGKPLQREGEQQLRLEALNQLAASAIGPRGCQPGACHHSACAFARAYPSQHSLATAGQNVSTCFHSIDTKGPNKKFSRCDSQNSSLCTYACVNSGVRQALERNAAGS